MGGGGGGANLVGACRHSCFSCFACVAAVSALVTLTATSASQGLSCCSAPQQRHAMQQHVSELVLTNALSAHLCWPHSSCTPPLTSAHLLHSSCTAAQHRLLHFEVRDAAGEMQPLERLELIKEPLQLTGVVCVCVVCLYGRGGGAARVWC